MNFLRVRGSLCVSQLQSETLFHIVRVMVGYVYE